MKKQPYRPLSPASKLEFTGVRQMDQAQKNSQPVVDAIANNPLIPAAGEGIWIRRRTLVSNVNTTISHGLQRKPRGWVITRATGNPAVAKEVSSDDKSIVLNQSNLAGDTVVDIWLF